MIHRATSDLRLPSHHSRAVLFESPSRWDEYLDLNIPILIAHSCSSWARLGQTLWESGLSSERVIRLVESDGAVKTVRIDGGTLQPPPESDTWTLALNWTHPEEGWRTQLPLYGKKYIVTRQSEQAKGMIQQIEELGAQAISVPTIDFVEPDDLSTIADAIRRLNDFDWLIFTSPNGVRYFFDYLERSGQDHRTLGKTRFACIGPGTARALAKVGFLSDVLPQEFVAEGLLAALDSRDLTGKPVLIPRAQEARDILPQTLKQRGARVVVAPVYKTVHPPLPDMVQPWFEEYTRVLFTSSSTVKNWIKTTENRDLPCFCIGPITAATAEEENLRVLGVAEVHTIDGLVQEIVRYEGAAGSHSPSFQEGR
jgi:uroporphyrinogen-III synthase